MEALDTRGATSDGTDLVAEGKQRGPAQKEPRDEMKKGVLRSFDQQQGADPTADYAGNQQRDEQAQRSTEMFQVSDGAGCEPRPQRNGICGICGNGRHAGEQHDRKRNKATAAGDGVEGSGDDRPEQQKDGLGEAQGSGFIRKGECRNRKVERVRRLDEGSPA